MVYNTVVVPSGQNAYFFQHFMPRVLSFPIKNEHAKPETKTNMVHKGM